MVFEGNTNVQYNDTFSNNSSDIDYQLLIFQSRSSLYYLPSLFPTNLLDWYLRCLSSEKYCSSSVQSLFPSNSASFILIRRFIGAHWWLYALRVINVLFRKTKTDKNYKQNKTKPIGRLIQKDRKHHNIIRTKRNRLYKRQQLILTAYKSILASTDIV